MQEINPAIADTISKIIATIDAFPAADQPRVVRALLNDEAFRRLRGLSRWNDNKELRKLRAQRYRQKPHVKKADAERSRRNWRKMTPEQREKYRARKRRYAREWRKRHEPVFDKTRIAAQLHGSDQQ